MMPALQEGGEWYLFSIRKQALSADAALTYPLMLFPFPRHYTPAALFANLTKMLHHFQRVCLKMANRYTINKCITIFHRVLIDKYGL